MNDALADMPLASASPQQHLVTLLDSHRPSSLLMLSMNPAPAIESWCNEHDCTFTAIAELDPFPALADTARFDLVIIADQLEYMTHEQGEALLGLVRNLHSDAMLVLYQSTLAPHKLRWKLSDFFGMGLRRDAVFRDGAREMTLFSYELASYNFVRSWNNPRFWANPENWGKYWW